MATQLEAPPRRKRQLEVCPWCGQELLDHDAIRHVEESERRHQHDVEAAAKAKAYQLAAELTKKKSAELDRLQRVVTVEREKLTEERARHAEVLREQKAKLRADAEREAATRVRSDLRSKERLIERLKEQIDEQSREIEHLTADERGEFNEETLLRDLQAAFPDDHIERVGRGRAGGDLLHEVRVSSGDGPVVAGLIVYECKDTLRWSNSFLEQAQAEGRRHQTPYLVIVTQAFKRGEKPLTVKDGVVVVHPTRLIDLAMVMRRMVVEVHRAGLAGAGQAAKSTELCEYLSGVEFRQAFDELSNSSQKLIGLLGKERTWHERDWARRQAIYQDVGRKTAAIDTRIRTIIEKQPSMASEGR
jgi:hypothetical protein